MKRAVELIVIGGSAGAFEPLQVVLRRLPATFPAGVAVVIHLPAEGPGIFPEIFARSDGPRVKIAEDKEPIEGGTVYFAATDYHLLVESGKTFALSLDERVHFSRPSIDVLFESAAAAYGDRLMGVILSGANEDGAAGLRAVADAGGVAVVQSLESSEMIAMPAAALEAVPEGIEADPAALAELLQAHAQARGNDNGG